MQIWWYANINFRRYNLLVLSHVHVHFITLFIVYAFLYNLYIPNKVMFLAGKARAIIARPDLYDLIVRLLCWFNGRSELIDTLAGEIFI